MLEKNWITKIKCRFKRCIEPNDIGQEKLEQEIKQGAILIDVRSPQEYQEGHLSGAICIPEYSIETEIGEIIENKQKKIILYCDSGGRSKRAQKTLEKKGYTCVYNLYQGCQNCKNMLK